MKGDPQIMAINQERSFTTKYTGDLRPQRRFRLIDSGIANDQYWSNPQRVLAAILKKNGELMLIGKLRSILNGLTNGRRVNLWLLLNVLCDGTQK